METIATLQNQEQFRHESEVREWIQRRLSRDAVWLRLALFDIEKRRGKVAADRLRKDIAEQWQRGNRGEYGRWDA